MNKRASEEIKERAIELYNNGLSRCDLFPNIKYTEMCYKIGEDLSLTIYQKA